MLTCSNPGEFLPRQYFPHTWRHKLKLSPIHTHHTNVHTPIHNGPLVLARFGSTTMIAAIQSIHQRILVLTQKGHNARVMHTLTHPPIAHIESRLRRFTTPVLWGRYSLLSACRRSALAKRFLSPCLGHYSRPVPVSYCPPRSTGRRRSTLACCARPSAAGPVVNS